MRRRALGALPHVRARTGIAPPLSCCARARATFALHLSLTSRLSTTRALPPNRSKLANAVFTLALRDRLAARHPKVLALVAAPGLAATNLQVTTAAQGGFADAWIMRFAQSAEDGAMPLLTCMLAAGVRSGELYEPAGMTGLAARVDLDAEAISANPASRAMLWAESEKACGAWDL